MTIYGALEILFHPDEYQRLYNCSAYEVDTIPRESRVKPYLGAVYIVLFVVYQSCHLICLPVIWKRMKDSSCYKIMFFMSVLDISCLPVIALGSGIFMFSGTVFCSNPTMMYALGVPTLAWWYTSTAAAVVLALNRCVNLTSRMWSQRLFDGRKTWLWLACALLYGVHHTVFLQPLMFSGVIGCWHFNPHLGYLNDTSHNYSAKPLMEHNVVVVTSLIALYGTFCLSLAWKKRHPDAGDGKNHVNVKALFLQVLLISAAHLSTASIYVFMHYVYANRVVASFAQLMWISAQGMPGVAYLTMNASLRREVKRMLFFPKKRAKVVWNTSDNNAPGAKRNPAD